jgi:hypothetical protein
MFPQAITREQITQALNQLWELHDKAVEKDNQVLAEQYKSEAFKVLEMLPENSIYLKTVQ